MPGDSVVMNAKERHSGVDVIHKCLPEGGDSILTVFSTKEPLQQDYYANY